MAEYSWSDASAMWQVQHGERGTPRTDSAIAWLTERLGWLEDRLEEWCANGEIMGGDCGSL